MKRILSTAVALAVIAFAGWRVCEPTTGRRPGAAAEDLREESFVPKIAPEDAVVSAVGYEW